MDALMTPGNAPMTMTSLEIATLVDSRHDKVKQSIERLAERGAITLPQLGEVSNSGASPKSIGVYMVGKRDSYVIVAQLSPEFTARLGDRWQELEQLSAPALPDLSNPTALRGLLLTYTDKVLALEATVSAQAPKVAFAEAVGAAENDQKVREVAKALGIGPRKLLAFLKDNGILMRDGLPFQHHIECGRFRVVEVAYDDPRDGSKRMRLQTRVTGKGVTFLQQRLA